MSAYDDSPVVYVDPFLGAGAVYLRLLGPNLVPFVSWMGGKRKLAGELLRLLGLRTGHPVPAVLGDACWWGWVWAVVLDPVLGPEVSAMLRFWRDREVRDPLEPLLPPRRQDPRDLWFALRSYGPLSHPVEAAAQLLWLQARAASGVPVWWASGTAQGPGYNTGQRARDEARAVARSGPEQWASSKVDAAGQRQASELFASDGRGVPRATGQRGERLFSHGGGAGHAYEAGHKGSAGGIVDPGTIAHRLDEARHQLVKASGGLADLGRDASTRERKGWRAFEPSDVAERLDAARGRVELGSVTILNADAMALTAEYAQRLGARARVMLDPPYQGKTGYPAECSRAEVLRIAEVWARHGGRVLVCEAEGLAAELGGGWVQEQLAAGDKPEWVTCYNCDVDALRPALFRHITQVTEPLPLLGTSRGGEDPRPTPKDRAHE